MYGKPRVFYRNQRYGNDEYRGYSQPGFSVVIGTHEGHVTRVESTRQYDLDFGTLPVSSRSGLIRSDNRPVRLRIVLTHGGCSLQCDYSGDRSGEENSAPAAGWVSRRRGSAGELSRLCDELEAHVWLSYPRNFVCLLVATLSLCSSQLVSLLVTTLPLFSSQLCLCSRRNFVSLLVATLREDSPA